MQVDAPNGRRRSQFRVNLGTEPPSLDWSLATDHVSFNVIANLMVGLTEFDKDLKPAPVIAKSWDVLDGGKKFVFHLRDDVKWSDGKRSAPRISSTPGSGCSILKPARNTPISFRHCQCAKIRRGENQRCLRRSASKPTDDHTLVVTLRHPASYFLAITTFEVTYPQRQDIVEKFESRWTEPANIVTNGPFRLAVMEA